MANQLLSNSLWLIVQKLLLLLIAFFMTPYMLRQLGTSQYGIFVLILSLTNLFGAFNTSFGQTTLRFVAAERGVENFGHIRKIVWTCWSLNVVAVVVVGGLLVVSVPTVITWLQIKPGDYELIRQALLIAVLLFVVEGFFSAFQVLPMAFERYEWHTLVAVTQSLLQVAGFVWLLSAGYGVVELVTWILVLSITFGGVKLIVAGQLHQNLFRLGNFWIAGRSRSILRFSAFTLLNHVLAIIWLQIDKWLLGVLMSTSAVALLNIPQQLSEKGHMLIHSSAQILMPRFSLTQDIEKTKQLFSVSTWLMSVLSLSFFMPFALILFDFLRLWIGPEIAEQATEVGVLILAGFSLKGAFAPYQHYLVGKNKAHILTVQSLLSTVWAVVLGVVLIPLYGLNGAGYGFIMSNLVGFAFLVFTWCRLLVVSKGLQLLFPVVLGPMFATCIALTVLLPLKQWVGIIDNWFILFVFGAFGSLVTMVCCLLLDRLIGGAKPASLFVQEYLVVYLVSWLRQRKMFKSKWKET
uniref:Polysaccharide biosynthesis protein n=1 Tax=Magnetococcus massalia (strain MO-1) TaxID=451514 RepID=A0A1S7LIW1_MAGMO|nr:Membrane protein of unknown function [Candidatus Magnetococcus massalia]